MSVGDLLMRRSLFAAAPESDEENELIPTPPKSNLLLAQEEDSAIEQPRRQDTPRPSPSKRKFDDDDQFDERPSSPARAEKANECTSREKDETAAEPPMAASTLPVYEVRRTPPIFLPPNNPVPQDLTPRQSFTITPEEQTHVMAKLLERGQNRINNRLTSLLADNPESLKNLDDAVIEAMGELEAQEAAPVSGHVITPQKLNFDRLKFTVNTDVEAPPRDNLDDSIKRKTAEINELFVVDDNDTMMNGLNALVDMLTEPGSLSAAEITILKVITSVVKSSFFILLKKLRWSVEPADYGMLVKTISFFVLGMYGERVKEVLASRTKTVECKRKFLCLLILPAAAVTFLRRRKMNTPPDEQAPPPVPLAWNPPSPQQDSGPCAHQYYSPLMNNMAPRRYSAQSIVELRPPTLMSRYNNNKRGRMII